MAVLKYELIADSLRQRIADGEFGSDDLLPSQRDLCAQWDVSRATVIKAYDLLVNDGLVVARQGQGFRPSPIPVARPAGGREEGTARTAGGRAYRIVGTPTREVPSARVAAALGLSDGAQALRRDRLIELADGSPLSLVAAWFPPEIADRCPRLSDRKQIIEGTTRYIARMTGRRPSQGADVTAVRLGTADEAEALSRQQPFAVAEVLHTAQDAEGRALVVELGVTPEGLWENVQTYPMGGGR
ncbi:GntR family transcriptional regulator [Streptomyces endophyticus]|uniref:GntR family transcriptional regulator n=1 Tax=Streptomyces endophyticus TaxID=714166 RepID=A0ABU6F3H5_9ACTN|nr:GntR family transcriptional regulator [Streptomyces endophyticus]MEB8338038.1 GntR family transcriptional regulator [Streptomyces endophyticus]